MNLNGTGNGTSGNNRIGGGRQVGSPSTEKPVSPTLNASPFDAVNESTLQIQQGNLGLVKVNSSTKSSKAETKKTKTFKEILQILDDEKKRKDADRKEPSNIETTPVKDDKSSGDEIVVEEEVSVDENTEQETSSQQESRLTVEDVLDSFSKTRTSFFPWTKQSADQRRDDANLWKLLTEVTDFKGINASDSPSTETHDPLESWFENVKNDVKKTAEEKRTEVFKKLLDGLVKIEEENLKLSNNEEITSSIDSVFNFIDKYSTIANINSEKLTNVKNDVVKKLFDGLEEKHQEYDQEIERLTNEAFNLRKKQVFNSQINSYDLYKINEKKDVIVKEHEFIKDTIVNFIKNNTEKAGINPKDAVKDEILIILGKKSEENHSQDAVRLLNFLSLIENQDYFPDLENTDEDKNIKDQLLSTFQLAHDRLSNEIEQTTEVFNNELRLCNKEIDYIKSKISDLYKDIRFLDPNMDKDTIERVHEDINQRTASNAFVPGLEDWQDDKKEIEKFKVKTAEKLKALTQETIEIFLKLPQELQDQLIGSPKSADVKFQPDDLNKLIESLDNWINATDPDS